MFAYYQQAPRPETIPAEIVAAITAALAVYLRPGSTSWQITSIRPQVAPARRWSQAGRQELINASLAFERRRPAV
ncbi:hypothetical protein [Moorella sp. Hama-1]|uniref:hypothetical protein n=1 Tax=Moorella sp. Hama-1 TaxID=2138101 RepID=UPI000D642C2F|nr:hypothetical protein [Moorella sp. Hama-1]MDN5361477.1 hypothetical protein [Moorella sp. (in: firmicutes)]BCV21242.1 hypothetical protein hamaS1_13110 [Moorella sp. Hama-1]